MNHSPLKNREKFNSRWGFILASIGSAVGMGNIWRFPVMVSRYGGLTFLIPYFIFVILICCSGLMEEIALGRFAGAGPVGAFGKCTEARTGNKKYGEIIGILPVVGSMGLAIGYTVVIGWIAKYCFMSIDGSLYKLGTDMAKIGSEFNLAAPQTNTLGEALSMMFGNGVFNVGNSVWQLIGLVVSLVIVAFGVSKGIEKTNKIMMPLLFTFFVIMGVYVAFQPNASVGYKYIFTLSVNGLLNPEMWIFAFGQAFFSLSVAGNGSVIYGSYLNKKEDIFSCAKNVAIFDTLAAMLATLVIIPSMAVVGTAPSNSGPGLLFVHLVKVLNGMVGGRIIGIVFFTCILFAGISSIVNLYEVPIALLQDKLHIKRISAVAIVGGIGGAISLLIQPWTSQWMDIVSIYICPLGAFLAGVMFFWVLNKDTALDSINTGAKKPIGHWFYRLGRWGYCSLALVALIVGAILGGIG